MVFSDRSKILILVVLVLVAIYLLGTSSCEPFKGNNGKNKDHKEHMSGNLNGNLNGNSNGSNELANLDATETDMSQIINSEESRSVESKEEKLEREFVDKMTTRDMAKNGVYKRSSYIGGNRDAKSKSLDKFFEEGSPFNMNGSQGFSPMDETGGDYASYVPGRKKRMTDVDLFKASDLLPNETNKDWFEDVYATTTKNKHYINVYRPVGVNTIQTSLKNPSHDIRGTPPNPKYVVSPWLQSSIEPDTNLRNQALCY